VSNRLGRVAAVLSLAVVLVGDSNIMLSAGHFSALLYGGWLNEGGGVPGYLPTIATLPGTGLRDQAWPLAIEEIVDAQDFEASAVALTVNDCMGARYPGEVPYVFEAQDYAARIDAIMRALPAGPVVWIDAPYATHPAYDVACLGQVNTALQNAVSRWPGRLLYLNVNDVLALLPANKRFLDGIHYTIDAQVRIGQRIHELLAPVL